MGESEWPTIGVVGQGWRARVSPWGSISEAGGSEKSIARPLEWHVAADDRWHDPTAGSTVRQRRIDGTPVFETRIRIPDGDAVQRVWCVADRGGATVIEFENDSPLAMAVAVTGGQLVAARPPADVPVQGIDLPADTVVLPVGHHATVRVAVPHTAVHDLDVSSLPGPEAVARGWRGLTDSASRLDLPDQSLVDAVVSARCDLLMDGPISADDDPAGFLMDVGQLVRLGEDADRWLPFLIEPAERVARKGGEDVGSALAAMARVAVAADDERATGDVQRLQRRLLGPATADHPETSFSGLRRERSCGRFVTNVESLIVSDGTLLPAGIPNGWLGADFEVHGVPSGPRGSIGFAVRWHGERPAVLWDQRGPVVELDAPEMDPHWSTSSRSGEALWRPQRGRTPLAMSDEARGS